MVNEKIIHEQMPISEIHNIDNLQYMKTLPDKFFDLAIVDPPYGIGAPSMSMGTNLTRSGDGYPATSTAKKLQSRYKGAGKLKNRNLNLNSDKFSDWDIKPSRAYFDELFRVSKNQIIWGGNYFNLPPSRGIIVWDKCQPWENFSQVEIAWTSLDCPAALFRHANTGGQNKYPKIHPTQKPIELYAYCLRKYAKKGDIIFDSHLGSGSSRIAAYWLGFDFYATEIDETYFSESEKRFQERCRGTVIREGIAIVQPSLFEGL